MTALRSFRPLAAAAICGIFAATTFAAEFQDEGGAPSEVVLRVKGKPGDKKSSTCEMQYKLTAPDGKITGPITLTGHINCEVSATDDKQTTRRYSFTTFDSKNDTVGLAEFLNKSPFMQFTGSMTHDTHGNSLHQSGYTKPQESYNFPEGPVKVGDTWQGWLGKHETRKPITYKLERIIRVHGDDIAVISKESPAWHDHKETFWFDVTKGDFVGDTIEETQYRKTGVANVKLSIFDPL